MICSFQLLIFQGVGAFLLLVPWDEGWPRFDESPDLVRFGHLFRAENVTSGESKGYFEAGKIFPFQIGDVKTQIFWMD